jgi:heptosyltransferase II
MAEIHCQHFNGYKPCGLSTQCDELCPHRKIPQVRVLVVHLEALGAVLRATSLLPAIKRKFPSSHITWITQKPAQAFFENQNLVDRVMTCDPDGLLSLRALEFDVALCLDKSLKASGVLASTNYDILYGYQADPRTGAILPVNPEAQEYWQLGLSNEKKFFENKKPETQLLAEALALNFHRDEYQIILNKSEMAEASHRAQVWGADKNWILGINTGCSATIAAKKLTVEYHRRLIQEIQRSGHSISVVLLGGGVEDEQRNLEIGDGLDVVISSSVKGIRDGLISVQACDFMITGDSLGMHMGIALKKYVIAWFGPTCAHEIDFFDRGEAVLTDATCSPCWKRTCNKSPMCYDLVPQSRFQESVSRGIQWLEKSSLSKLPFLETFSSVFP